MYDQTGSEKSNMVAYKLEVPTSQLVYKIGTKSLRLSLFSGSRYPIGLIVMLIDQTVGGKFTMAAYQLQLGRRLGFPTSGSVEIYSNLTN